jgi:hypothetical protein
MLRSKGRGFHESYAQGEVKPPSARSTGLLFAVVAVIVAILWRQSLPVAATACGAAVVLAGLSLAVPSVLEPLNILWFRFGLVLHRVVNPLVMLAMFVLVILPAGLIMRIRYDPLRRKRARSGSSYWIERGASAQRGGSMTNQF